MRHRLERGCKARRWRVLAVGVLAVVAAGCGPESGDTTATDSSPTERGETGAAESAPFTVGPVPEGYRLAVAGTGTAVAMWGSDSGGTDEPYTVLSPNGTATGPEVVVVSITGFGDYEMGFDQASAGSEETTEELTVDGKDARYAPARRDDRGELWADLVALRGDDLAVRVTSPDGTREELLAVLAEVDVAADHTRAPAVPDPPDGLRVVGSVDVDAVLALEPSYFDATRDAVAGSPASHSAGWLAEGSGENTQLSVLTLPGRSVDLPAIAVQQDRDVGWHEVSESHEREVGGRPALAIETRFARSVWVDSAWGDTVVVTARGRSGPSEDELVALAASVEPADEAAWEAFVIEAAGGPGLHADAGRTELARGQAGDLEWLLQSGPVGGFDSCLKLSNRTHACPDGTGVGNEQDDTFVHSSADPEGDLPPFVVLSTTLQAASVRVTTATDESAAPLVPVPEGGRWVAAVFVDDPGFPVCEEGPPTPVPEVLTAMRVDALDAQGQVVGCLGWGTAAHPAGG